jgi:hypothetical protein
VNAKGKYGCMVEGCDQRSDTVQGLTTHMARAHKEEYASDPYIKAALNKLRDAEAKAAHPQVAPALEPTEEIDVPVIRRSDGKPVAALPEQQPIVELQETAREASKAEGGVFKEPARTSENDAPEFIMSIDPSAHADMMDATIYALAGLKPRKAHNYRDELIDVLMLAIKDPDALSDLAMQRIPELAKGA